MSRRLHRLIEAELNDEQLAIYRNITRGPRAAGKQHFPLTAGDGSLHGPFGVMLHAPALGQPLQELGSALRYRGNLSDRAREIVILRVAVITGSEFEWYAHRRVAAAIGISELELQALARPEGRLPDADATEAAVLALANKLAVQHELSDQEFEQISGSLDVAAMIEVIALVGYYRTLAQLMNVFEIGAPVSAEDEID